jgi:hypothetical protein
VSGVWGQRKSSPARTANQPTPVKCRSLRERRQPETPLRFHRGAWTTTARVGKGRG